MLIYVLHGRSFFLNKCWISHHAFCFCRAAFFRIHLFFHLPFYTIENYLFPSLDNSCLVIYFLVLYNITTRACYSQDRYISCWHFSFVCNTLLSQIEQAQHFITLSSKSFASIEVYVHHICIQILKNAVCNNVHITRK